MKYSSQQNRDATIQGMVEHIEIHPLDINYSSTLLEMVFKTKPMNRALDVGAGIGRVTKGVLSKYFKTIDILEPAKKLIEFAQQDPEIQKVVGNFYNVKLQDFNFSNGVKYDCIWMEWVIAYMHNSTIMDVLTKLKQSLSTDGIVVVVDNLSPSSSYVDGDDMLVVRSINDYISLLQAPGYIIKHMAIEYYESVNPMIAFILVPEKRAICNALAD